MEKNNKNGNFGMLELFFIHIFGINVYNISRNAVYSDHLGIPFPLWVLHFDQNGKM